LSTYGFGLRRLVGGGYDGCLAMAGWIKGVLMLIRAKYAKALFFHCARNDSAVVHNMICTGKDIVVFLRESSLLRNLSRLYHFSLKRASLQYIKVSQFFLRIIRLS
jgi:hypothetical protein